MGTKMKLIELVTSTIKGHKSHWQETITQRDRDQLLDTVAVHVAAVIEEFPPFAEDDLVKAADVVCRQFFSPIRYKNQINDKMGILRDVVEAYRKEKYE